MKTWSCLICLFAFTGASSSSALAVDYHINRSWTDGIGTASLNGTVSLAEGTYNIRNGAPNPFTDVNLTVTVNGTSSFLDAADVSIIKGNGKFDITATASSLTFDSRDGDGSNPADLIFINSINNNSYGIGMDDGGAFQGAFVFPQLVFVPQSFPTVFGVVPEPSSAAIACLGGVAATLGRRRRSHGRFAQRT